MPGGAPLGLHRWVIFSLRCREEEVHNEIIHRILPKYQTQHIEVIDKKSSEPRSNECWRPITSYHEGLRSSSCFPEKGRSDCTVSVVELWLPQLEGSKAEWM